MPHNSFRIAETSDNLSDLPVPYVEPDESDIDIFVIRSNAAQRTYTQVYVHDFPGRNEEDDEVDLVTYDSDDDDREHYREQYCHDEDEYNLEFPYRWCNLIHRWDANIFDFKQIKLDPKKRYYGVELEVLFKVANRSNYRKIAAALTEAPWAKDTLLVHDGSFSSYGAGAEIVSVPLEYNLALDLGYKILHNESFDSMPLRFFDKVDCTGMHIHVSKSSLSLLTEYKIYKLVYSNPEWFKEITNKNLDRYCSYGRKDSSLFKRLTTRHKYVAINTCNRNTLEFRFFTVPLTYTGFLHRVNFVKAILDFCENTGCQDITLENFQNSVYFKKVDTVHVSNR